eukprot:jgi/Astpho2/3138/Aster-03421
MEEVFTNTEARVVAAYKSQSKERVVCLTAERRSKRRGFKGSLHICKYSAGKTQASSRTGIRSSFLLKHMTRMEAFLDEEEGKPQFLEMWFQSSTFGSDTKTAMQLDRGALEEVMGTVYLFCKKHERKQPQVVGYDTALLDRWVSSQEGKLVDLEGVGAFGAALLGHEADAGGAGSAGGSSLVSAKEEKDLQTLLEMFALGVGDVEEFQERLQAELAALEAANVHAILESGPLVATVMLRLQDAISLINDLDENLHIFDIKLRHMREDIAAIEARNNRLELQARNNSKLLVALEELLDRLTLPEDTEQLLVQANFDINSLEEMVSAGWDLVQHLEGLQDVSVSPKGLEQGLASMEAVSEQRSRLQSLSKVFVERASRFLSGELTHVGDSTMTAISDIQLVPEQAPFHRAIHVRTGSLEPLMQVVYALKPGSLHPLRERYCQTLNILLRKELRICTSGVRKTIMATPQAAADSDTIKAEGKHELLEGLVAPSRTTARSLLEDSSPTKWSIPSKADLGMVAKPGRKDPGGPQLPHKTFQVFLDTWLPFFLAEARHAAAFLLLYAPVPVTEKAAPAPVQPPSPTVTSPQQPGSARAAAARAAAEAAAAKAAEEAEEELSPIDASAAAQAAAEEAGVLLPEGPAVIASLIVGVHTDFQALVDLISKADPLVSVPMLRGVLLWQASLSRQPLADALLRLVNDCCEWLLGHFERFITDRVASINKFDSKSSLGLADGVKSLHVLPFFATFASLATRLEDLLADDPSSPPLPGRKATENEDEDDLSIMSEELEEDPETEPAHGEGDDDDEDGPRQSLEERRQSVREAGPRGALPQATSRKQALAPDVIPPAHKLHNIREAVTPAYFKLVQAMFATLERVAASDPKHGDRLRLESYAYFVRALDPLASQTAGIQQFHAQAQVAKQVAKQVYVQQQLEYGRFRALLEFATNVDQLVKDLGPEEVPFQLHYQVADLRALLAATFEKTQKRFNAMWARIHKHMGTSSPGLIGEVWESMQTLLLEKCGLLEAHMVKCYPSVHLTVTEGDIKNMMLAAESNLTSK